MLHGDVSGHMNNINMTWNYFTDHLAGGKEVAYFEMGN